jgi:uncharacterized membrane protein
MKPEKIWLCATGFVLLLGMLLTLLGHVTADARLSDAGLWVLASGIFLGFVPILIGIGWLVWEKVFRRKTTV